MLTIPVQIRSNDSARFFAPAPSILVLMALSLGGVGNLTAQDAQDMAIIKTQYFQQISANIVMLVNEDSGEAPLVFEAMAFASAPNFLTSGFLRRPSGPDVFLTLEDGGEDLLYEEGFTTPSEMNAAFTDGSYTLNLVGANDGPKAVGLDLSGDAYAGLTRFTMFESAQSIDASGAMSFEWDPIPNGTVDDLVFLLIEDKSGEELFESPDVGEAGALDGTSTSVSVPAGTLDPRTEYNAFLEVYRPVDSNESYAPGVTAFSAYGKSLRMPIQTIGPAPVTIPKLVRSIPDDLWQDVELNTIITFVFDEAMDTTVSVDQTVTWTGVSNAAQFSYRWSQDAKTLFCNYTPGLPSSATIGWTLNPAGSSAKLRNAGGHNLPDDLPGSFTTSDTSNLGVPDVKFFSLIKAKLFGQNGATPVDTGSYFAELFVELNGTSTVSSVDLDIPGGRTETDLGKLMYDFEEIEGNAAYAQQADLDLIFPNGSYQIIMHTFHDGVQSVTLNLGPDSYPNAPVIQNFAATQAWDGSQAFTLNWDAMAGGTTSDFIALEVEGETACFFSSPDVGAPGALDGTATSLTLPANTLPPGRTLEAELVFVRIIDNDTSQYPGVRCISAFITVTNFTIQTTGTPFVPRLAVSHNGAEAKVTVTAERGREYEISSSEDLRTWTPAWTEWLSDDGNGYRGTFDYFDTVTGIPARYYQVRELTLEP